MFDIPIPMLMPFPGETGHSARPTSSVKAMVKTEHAVVGEAVGELVGEAVGEQVEQSHSDTPSTYSSTGQAHSSKAELPIEVESGMVTDPRLVQP
jgi:hypothetical protein